MNKDSATNNAKIKISAKDWCVQHHTPSVDQRKILYNQIISKLLTDLHYPEISVFIKELNNEHFWSFEIETQEEINVPVWVYVLFQQNERQHDRNSNNDTFYRMRVSSVQVNIGTEKYPDSGSFLNYDDGDYFQGYGQVKEAFRALTKDDTVQRYKSEEDFGSYNDGNDIGYNIHSFNIRYQKNFESAHPIKVEFKSSANNSLGYMVML